MTNFKARKQDFRDSFSLDRERQRIRIMKIMFALFSMVLLISLVISLLLSH